MHPATRGAEQLERLTNCEAALVAFKFQQATGCALPLPAPSTPAAAAVPVTVPPLPLPPTVAGFTVDAPPTVALAGFTVDVAPPGDLGAALVGRQLLYWSVQWPDKADSTARSPICPRGAISHWHVVAAYTRQTSALRGTADSLRLLDSEPPCLPSPTVPGPGECSAGALSRPSRRRRGPSRVSGQPSGDPDPGGETEHSKSLRLRRRLDAGDAAAGTPRGRRRSPSRRRGQVKLNSRF
jgi:hypothetical protein